MILSETMLYYIHIVVHFDYTQRRRLRRFGERFRFRETMNFNIDFGRGNGFFLLFSKGLVMYNSPVYPFR